MNDRVDAPFPGGVYTKKSMPNGELRTRIKLHEGPVHSFSTTVMNSWNWDDGVPWQVAHFHKGLTEHYVVYKGWVVFGERNPNYETNFHAHKYHGFVRIACPKEVISFGPNEPHIVLLGPGAIIGTLISGEEIGNPEKNNNDWWPADEDMNSWVRQCPVEQLKKAIFDAEALPRMQPSARR